MTRTGGIRLIPAILLVYLLTIPINYALHKNYLGGAKERDVIQKVLGSMRGMAADWAWIRSEEYFHKGLPFIKAMECCNGREIMAEAVTEGADRVSDEGHGSHGDHEGHVLGSAHVHTHEHNEDQEHGKNFYNRLLSVLKVTQHSHLTSSEEKEVLPWYYIEVMLNPNDEKGYVTGGYFIGMLGKKEEAMKFLKEGLKNNPDSARINGAIGWQYFAAKDYDNALPYLERARELYNKASLKDIIQTIYEESDLYNTYDMLGYIYEQKGRLRDAIQVYSELYSYQPDQGHILEKVKELSAKINAEM